VGEAGADAPRLRPSGRLLRPPGFGKSSQPTTGYDYDTFAADLNIIMNTLDLRDAVLAGFSMGTGEVTRYLGTYGPGRVAKAAQFGPLGPYLLQADDNPEGVPAKVFEDIKAAIREDRFAYQKSFLDNFYNVDVYRGTRISDQAWQNSWNVAAGASALGTLKCVDTWGTDFRGDMAALGSVPLLVVQGSDDRILPPPNSGRRLPALVPHGEYHEINGGPHNIGWTHADELNPLFEAFLAK
jgi:non-heme chloroperoxidase